MNYVIDYVDTRDFLSLDLYVHYILTSLITRIHLHVHFYAVISYNLRARLRMFISSLVSSIN
jgi:hypothetical protein